LLRAREEKKEVPRVLGRIGEVWKQNRMTIQLPFHFAIATRLSDLCYGFNTF